MPFISIIIPTYNNEEHIEQAIQSCFDSDFDDFEIIVINDASTDGTAVKLERLADKYVGNIKINRLDNNIGPGPARNIGLEQAEGEYIMFLDGDDWFEHNAVKTVAEKLNEVKPDVLMFNHQRVWSNGKKKTNIPNKYVNLTTQSTDISLHARRVSTIQNIHCCWNKAYKHSFINSLKIRFPEGIYEDLLWSITMSIKAKKMFYLGSPVYNYRQRPKSITKSMSEEHFIFFAQANRIIKKLTTENEFKLYKKNIFNYLTNQAKGILNSNIRIPENKKDKFTEELQKLEDLTKEF